MKFAIKQEPIVHQVSIGQNHGFLWLIAMSVVALILYALS